MRVLAPIIVTCMDPHSDRGLHTTSCYRGDNNVAMIRLLCYKCIGTNRFTDLDQITTY
jgi:hypothetical protein